MSQPNNGEGFLGLQSLQSGGSEFNAQMFLIQSVLSKISTVTLVQVKAVTNNGGVEPVGFVDILPLVNQIDGAGNAVQHGTIYKCPYFRLQGGTDAIILDPKVGDIGIALFADRDISSVTANRSQANPGSRRRFDMSDGLYLGGVLNGVPAQYVRFTADGIVILSPSKVTIQAPSIFLDGNVTSSGTFTNNGTNISSTHVHGGITPGGSNTDTPS